MHSEQSWIRSAFAGFVATGPMTVFMLTSQRFLPKGQQYTLPPEMLTKDLMRRAHVRWHFSKIQILGVTLVSHFGYGTVVGALYRPLSKKGPLPAPVKGALFGIGVWVTSYFGLLPLLGMSASGQKEPGRRNFMMLLAHMLWGTVLGVVAEGLIKEA